jgi:YegS/Rv2252/BmrU family lipid kinase
MERKLFILNNPTSGGRSRNQRVMREVQDFVEAKQIHFELVLTQADRNAQAAVRERMDDTFTDLLIVGGDGTISESVNGLNRDIPVSIIPAGTGNDFVKMLGLGKTLQEQLETTLSGHLKRFDLGVCNGRKFVNGVGIGFDGQIVEDMKRKRVPLLTGHAKYYYHVLQILASYKERAFDFKIDESSHSEPLILMTIGNGTTFGGGFKLMPNARIDDGLLEVCTIAPIASVRRFLNIGKLSNGTHGALPEVHFYQAKSVRVEDNPLLFAHLDGEAIGQPPFEITISENALALRVKQE